MLWSELRLILKTSSVTPDFFYVFYLILSFSTVSQSFKKKLCVGSFWARTSLNHIWWRTFSFKVLIAIFWDLQPLWSSSLTKPDLLRFRCSSGHVISKRKSATPHFLFTFVTSLTHNLSIVKFSEKNQSLKYFA